MSSSRLRGIAFMIAAVALGGCRALTDPGFTDNHLAKERWAAERPASYDYTLSLTCFCPQDATRPVVIVVTGTTVVSRTYSDDGAPVSDQLAASFPSIDGLFATIDNAAAAHASKLSVTYDAKRGFPTRIDIDYSARAIDDEITYRIRDFHPRLTN